MTDRAPLAHPQPERQAPTSSRLSRRRFLHVVAVAAAGALAACAEAGQTTQFGPDAYATTAEIAVLESPQAPGTARPLPPGLDRFMRLSAVLTGVQALDPRLGAVYQQAVGRIPDVAPLETFYEQAGLAEPESEITVEGLRAAGVLNAGPTQKLAREIARLWYTGTFQQDGETQVATYVDALAWKTLRFTKPASTCGSFGFWATRPNVDVSGRAAGGRP